MVGPTQRPNLYNLYGTKQMLQSGQAITVDDAWLRGAILNPTTHLVAGYLPIMPTYQGQLTEEDLMQIVAYLNGSPGVAFSTTAAPDGSKPIGVPSR